MNVDAIKTADTTWQPDAIDKEALGDVDKWLKPAVERAVLSFNMNASGAHIAYDRPL